MPDRRSPRFWLALFVAAFGAVQVFLAYRDYVMEDAYVTYRYAQNLVEGHGFVFNHGERVLGTSTPLYTLILALAALLGADIPMASAVIAALSQAGVALAAGWLLRRLGYPNLALVLVVLLMWGPADLHFVFGMETPFYLLLLFLAFNSALLGLAGATGALLGLAFLTRHDAVIFSGCLLSLLWLKERRVPWRAGLTAVAVVLPWLAFAWSYFGSPFPNTLSAKAHDVEVATYFQESVAVQIHNLYTPLFRNIHPSLVPTIVISLLTLTLIGPVFAAWRRLFRRELLLAQALIFPLLLWIGYSLIAPPLEHPWYLVPGTYFFLFLCLASWGLVLEGWRLGPLPSLGVALALATMFLLPSRLREHAESWEESNFTRGRTGVYRTVGRWIGDKGLSEASVLMREPGYFAYHAGNPMVDGAGLATEGIYFHGPRERQTSPEELVERHRPGLIVTPPRYWPGLPLEDYFPLYHAVPVRTLYIRKSLFAARFERLAEDWLAREPYWPEAAELLGHPLDYDFERSVETDWVTGGRIYEPVGAPRPVEYRERRFAEDYLHTYGGREIWGTITSPPFVIDFDELTFLFAGTHRNLTLARLLVDGQAVLVEKGQGGELELVNVNWPVSTWRGKTAVLQFRDDDLGDGFLVADHVRSLRYERREVFDDFESEEYSELWVEGFGDRPAPLAPLALDRGLALMVGERAATSQGREGSQILRSRPFRIERDHMSFLAFDFGGADTRVELRVRGEVVREFRGARSRRLRGVVWGVRGLRGREAVLAVVDNAPLPNSWIGIDDIAVFDRPSVPQPESTTLEQSVNKGGGG